MHHVSSTFRKKTDFSIFAACGCAFLTAWPSREGHQPSCLSSQCHDESSMAQAHSNPPVSSFWPRLLDSKHSEEESTGRSMTCIWYFNRPSVAYTPSGVFAGFTRRRSTLGLAGPPDSSRGPRRTGSFSTQPLVTVPSGIAWNPGTQQAEPVPSSRYNFMPHNRRTSLKLDGRNCIPFIEAAVRPVATVST